MFFRSTYNRFTTPELVVSLPLIVMTLWLIIKIPMEKMNEFFHFRDDTVEHYISCHFCHLWLDVQVTGRAAPLGTQA